MYRKCIARLALLVSIATSATLSADEWQFEPHECICYIGNTLADRMQHHAWLESYLHALHPEHELVFRNLAFPADEVASRPRSQDFGSPDEWLTKCKADTVFCFFGYNEALRGEQALPQFRADLREMIEGMRAKRYNGRTPPQLLVFGPIAHENLHSPHLPDGRENNRRLRRITKTMREVCAALDVRFVDLFEITRRLYTGTDRVLTMNGVHLLERGNRLLAEAILSELLPHRGLPAAENISQLRNAVLDKNYYWFSRYRVVDGYNVYGGRSRLAWHGQSNADVMRREMEIFDIMTANRDRQIWAAARGEDAELKDNYLPPLLTVKTNKEGPLEGGRFPYLGAEEAIGKMHVHAEMKVNLFASEEQFPRLINPVQMAVDPDSRLWVSVWPSYPHWNPTEPRRDAILILPDEDADGVADKCVVFADQLNSITGFEFWGGGVIVAAPPELWFLRDTDGDDRADVKERILQGISSADTHHSANAMLIGPDGWLYWSRGIFNVANFETPTRTYRSAQSGVHRFNPRTFEVEFHFPIGPNPHGHVFDQWGYEFANDGTGGTGCYINIGKGVANKYWYQARVRPVAACGLLASSHFPESLQGNYLICNVIGVRGVLQHEIHYDGADITCEEIAPIVVSDDPNFRPSDLEIGGDGALYVADWHNALIGHMQHNIRDPNRDHEHGRIYRVTYPGRELLTPPKMKGRPITDVCENFFSRENGTRYRARLELSGRDTAHVIHDVDRFLATLSAQRSNPDRDEAQAMLECLWVLEEHRMPRMGLITALTDAEEPRIRAAAIRTLGHWSGKIENWQPTLLAAAVDESALVRAEALKAAVGFAGPVAIEVLFEVAIRPIDVELATILVYARKQLDVRTWIDRALAEGHTLSPAGRAYVVRHGSPAQQLQLKPAAEVYRAILMHEDSTPAQRQQALCALAHLTSKPLAELLLGCIEEKDQPTRRVTEALATALTAQPPAVLQSHLPKLRALALSGETTGMRQAGYRAWVAATDPIVVLSAIGAQPDRLAVFLQAIPALREAERDQLFTPLRLLLGERDLDDDIVTPTAVLQAIASIPGHEEAKLELFKDQLIKGRDGAAALQAIQTLRLETMTIGKLNSLTEMLIEFINEIPTRNRNAPLARDAFGLVSRLIERFPKKQADQMKARVLALRVPIIKISVVPHHIMFDSERIALEAGQPVEFHFSNPDAMPHNFVITQPGSLAEVGELAEQTGRDRDAIDRGYVPDSKMILCSSRLLQTDDHQTIHFTAPQKPGVYPFVCTYPGHWRRMFGALVVVHNLREYQAEPEQYLATHSIETVDPLLRSTRSAYPWSFDELIDDVRSVSSGRSFANGRNIFRAATCVGCHHLHGEGQVFGPKLEDLADRKHDVGYILRSLVEPSREIDRKFESHTFYLDSGKVLTGMIIDETIDGFKVVVGPLGVSELCDDSAVFLKRQEIEERVVSKNSLMPAGLLNRLSRDEILDLIAYVYAKGDPHHALFSQK